METLRGRPVPPALAGAVVLDARGQPRPLGACWKDGPCVLVLLRHFGCIGCDTQVADLAPRLHELRAAGARTVLVGNGPPDAIADFVARHALGDKDVEVFTDPSLAAFRAARLLRSAWATYGPRSIADYARALVGGFAPHRTLGDALQQGGALVVDAGGTVVLHRVARSLGDHADASDLVDAALALALRASPLRV
ncbi:MAG TPA: peroxiredoxin-like family protein [Polyangiaceae bacterium]